MTNRGTGASGLGNGSDYAQIKYSDFKVKTPAIEPGQSMKGSVTLSNFGKLAGVEVVQLFVRPAEGGGRQKRCTPRQLSQVRVNPGVSVTVDLSIPFECFQTVGAEAKLDMSHRQTFQVAVGGLSQDSVMQMATVLVTQKPTPVTRRRKSPKTAVMMDPVMTSTPIIETHSP